MLVKRSIPSLLALFFRLTASLFWRIQVPRIPQRTRRHISFIIGRYRHRAEDRGVYYRRGHMPGLILYQCSCCTMCAAACWRSYHAFPQALDVSLIATLDSDMPQRRRLYLAEVLTVVNYWSFRLTMTENTAYAQYHSYLQASRKTAEVARCKHLTRCVKMPGQSTISEHY